MIKLKREISKKLKKMRKEKRKGRRGMIQITVKLSCGCCCKEMQFISKESAKEAFNKAGLTNSGTITDDTGKIVNDVDTFYGFSLSNKDVKEMKETPLSRLAKRAGFI